MVGGRDHGINTAEQQAAVGYPGAPAYFAQRPVARNGLQKCEKQRQSAALRVSGDNRVDRQLPTIMPEDGGAQIKRQRSGSICRRGGKTASTSIFPHLCAPGR